MTASRPADHRAVMASRMEFIDFPDFFPTAPWGGRAGGELIKRLDPGARSAWECACGAGHLVHALKDYFPRVYASDAFDYGWGHAHFDFLSSERTPFVADWIVSNPPFGEKVEPFIRLAYQRARRGVAMLLQLRALEGVGRHHLFEDVPLTAVAPFAERMALQKGRWEPDGSTATAYAWFIFQKSQKRGVRPGPAVRIPIPPGTARRLTRPSDAAFAARAA